MIKDAYRDESPTMASPGLASTARMHDERAKDKDRETANRTSMNEPPLSADAANSTKGLSSSSRSKKASTAGSAAGSIANVAAAQAMPAPTLTSVSDARSPISAFYEHFGSRLPPLPRSSLPEYAVDTQASGSQSSYSSSLPQGMSDHHQYQSRNVTELVPVPQKKSRIKRARYDDVNNEASGPYQTELQNGMSMNGQGDAMGEDEDGDGEGEGDNEEDISDGECENRLRHIRRSLSIERRFDKAAELERPRLVRHRNNDNNNNSSNVDGDPAPAVYPPEPEGAEMQAADLARATQEHTARFRDSGWSFSAADDAWNK